MQPAAKRGAAKGSGVVANASRRHRAGNSKADGGDQEPADDRQWPLSLALAVCCWGVVENSGTRSVREPRFDDALEGRREERWGGDVFWDNMVNSSKLTPEKRTWNVLVCKDHVD